MKALISRRKVIRYTTPVSLKSKRLQCSQSSDQNNDTTVQKITSILNHNNWEFLLHSSHLSKTLNPDVIRSVLHQNKSVDSKRLFSFFNWSTSQMGTPQNLSSFSILAILLCNSNQFAHAYVVLEKMIETRSPVSLLVDSIVSSCIFCEVYRNNHAVLDMLIHIYKKKGKLNEAASVLVAAKNGDFLPSLVCASTLLKDLLKFNKMDLFWRVFDAMVEARFKLDVYCYNHLIKAHCKVGNVEEGKRVFLEMEEKGCSPNIFTYNVTIGGLCKAGLVDEAVELKQSMIEKGLAPDGYTYSMLIDGFCKQNRSKEAKSLLGEMPNVDLNAYQVAYTALMDGFMKEGDIEEAFRIKDEMVSRGIKFDYITYNAIINRLCKVGQTEKAKDLMGEMIVAEVNPDMMTYMTLIDGYSQEQKVDKAYELLVEMKERNLQPSFYMCSKKKGMPYYNELCRIFGYTPATGVHAHPSNKAPSSTDSSVPEFQFKDEVEIEEDSKAKPKAKGKKRDSFALNQLAENGKRGVKVMEMKLHNSHSRYSGVPGNMSIGEAGLGPLAAGMKDCQAVLNAMEDLDGDSYFKVLKKLHGDVLWREIFMDMPEKRRIEWIKKLWVVVLKLCYNFYFCAEIVLELLCLGLNCAGIAVFVLKPETVILIANTAINISVGESADIFEIAIYTAEIELVCVVQLERILQGYLCVWMGVWVSLICVCVCVCGFVWVLFAFASGIVLVFFQKQKKRIVLVLSNLGLGLLMLIVLVIA